MIDTATATRIDSAVAKLDAWFDTMRCAGGYGGPVAHWWQQSLLFCGAALDWRYEGIIAGYLHLWQRTNDEHWLRKACRAGDDLLRAQLPNGHFPASAFEINPATAGTPHEGACDVALLLLAQALKDRHDPDWQRYAACARRNLEQFYVAQLWQHEAQCFGDAPGTVSFVPNKAATAAEAFFLLSDLTGDARWAEQYAVPTLRQVIEHQVRGHGRLDGAIAQNSFGTQVIRKYFPIYIARCIPPLLRGYRWTHHARFLNGAYRAMLFILRWHHGDGSFPTVVYHNGRTNRFPSWRAPLGDILRAADELRAYGFAADLRAVEQRVLAAQDASGGIQTAAGFAAQAGGRVGALPDVRDLLHVAGWCDKAFRYLAAHATAPTHDATSDRFEAPCTFGKRVLRFVETPAMIEVADRTDIRYRWRKGAAWPEITAPEFWLR